MDLEIFGVRYLFAETCNHMFKNSKIRVVVILGVFIFVCLCIFGINQVLMLRKAHSTFSNYASFRGCVQLIKKTNENGICKTDQGQVIKIVKYNDKWYSDGDLPVCWMGMCF